MALQNPAVVTTQSSDSHSKVAVQAAIPADLAAKIARQVPMWSPERLADCKITRSRGSSFPGCKTEMEIYGPAGNVVVHGREFDDHHSFFWDA